jgi:hypothetical protein
VARIINGQDIHAIVTLATVGKGAIAKKASEALQIQGLDHYLNLDDLTGREWNLVHGLLAGEFGIVPDTLAPTAPERIKQLLDLDAAKRAAWLIDHNNLVTEAQEKRVQAQEKRHATVAAALSRWTTARDARIAAETANEAPTA